MKKLHALLLTSLMACSLVVVAATQALACSCVPPQPDRKAVKDAAAVFTGTVVDIEDGVDIGFDEVTWTFAVDTVYKGDIGPTQEVETHTQSAACGLVFKEQKRYVVFAHKGGPTEPVNSARDVLSSNSCMNTRPLAEGKEPKLEPIRSVVGPPLVEDRQEDFWARLWSWVLPASLFIVVTTTLFLWWLLRRRER